MNQERRTEAAKRGLTPAASDKRGSDPARRRAAGIAMPEVMLIISLVVILALLAYPKFYDSMTKASRDSALVASDALMKATAMYQLDKRVYPVSLAELGDYTNTSSLKKAYRVLTVVSASSTSCVHGVVSGIGSESTGEEYHILNCVNSANAATGGYCCMKPNSQTGTSNCDKTGLTPTASETNWYECKKRLY